MAGRYVPLGNTQVFRDRKTGEVVFDDQNLRRPSTGFEGEDFDGDEEFEGEDDETGDDDGDQTGEQSVDDFGRSHHNKKNKKGQHGNQHGHSRSSQHGSSHRGSTHNMNSSSAKKMGATTVSGSQTLGGAGAATIAIRLQHDFHAEDVTFEGSASGAKVISIFFGERPVWSSPNGIPVTVFAANSQMRKVLNGQNIRAGLDITISGSLSGPGDFVATFMGKKPLDNHC